MSWQETLEQAQNTIFCKEIYNQVNIFNDFIHYDFQSIYVKHFIAFKRSF